MRWIGLGVPLLCLGCLANDGLRSEADSQNNIWAIHLLSEGMSENKVIRIMGKPYDYQTFYVDEDVYDIWFYVTRPTGLGQTRMVHRNLTPLTFRNGCLLGWGYHLYEKALHSEKMQLQKEAAPLPPHKNEVPPKEELEDQHLEKTLEAPLSQTSQTSAPPGRDPKQDEPPGLEIHSWEPGEKPAAKPPDQKKESSPIDSEDSKPSDSTPKEEPPADTEGDRMLEDERRQDFNY